jgi:hypothetical protein
MVSNLPELILILVRPPPPAPVVALELHLLCRLSTKKDFYAKTRSRMCSCVYVADKYEAAGVVYFGGLLISKSFITAE